MLSTEQKNILNEIKEYGSNNFGFDTTRITALLLVCTKDRDGCLFTVDNKEQLNFLKQKIDALDLYYEEQQNGPLGLYITNSKSLLSNLSELDPYSVGKLFGYPEDAIEFYQNSNDPLTEFEEFLENETKYSGAGFYDKISQVEYIPSPTQSGIEEALQRQQKYESTLKSYPSIIPSKYI